MYLLIISHARRKAIKDSTVASWESTGFKKERKKGRKKKKPKPKLFLSDGNISKCNTGFSETLPSLQFICYSCNEFEEKLWSPFSMPLFKDRGFGHICWVLCLVLDSTFRRFLYLLFRAESSWIRPFHIVESKVHEYLQWGEGGRVGHTVGHKGEQSLLYILPYKQYSALNALYLLCIMFFYYPIIILFIVYFIKCALHSSHDCAVKARIRFRINVNIHSSTIFFKSNNKNKSE